MAVKRKPGPYLMVIPYFVNNIKHEATANCDVIGAPVTGTPPGGVTLRTKSGDGVTALVGANSLWAVLRPYLHTGVIAQTFELFKLNTTNGKRAFITGGTLAAPNGSSTGATVPAQQATFTFRTGAAHIMKLELIGVSIDKQSIAPLANGGTGETLALRTYILSGDNFTWGRDRAYPVVGLNESYGQNEKAWKRIYRAS